MTNKISLTGIKPTGIPHLGNYLGMIRPALQLAECYDALYFLADYHSLTTVQDGGQLRELTYQAAAVWMALGLDPGRVVFYRQSDVPEVFELAWILACVAPKGLLNRAHAYKDAVASNEAAGRPSDDGVSMGLYNYPVLMAADILAFGAHVVPVGADQKQHIEIARDLAASFNRLYGEILVLPEAHIEDDVAVVPGTDGRKMSKSYGNVIPIFEDARALRKVVMRIVTDSRRPEESKDPDADTLFSLYRQFAPASEAGALAARYKQGGVGYGEVKQLLFDALRATFGPLQQRYEELLSDRALIDAALASGARRARALASPLMRRVRQAVGTGF